MGIMEDSHKYIMNTYARAPVAFIRGEGATLWDAGGAEYKDFLAGIAVTNLGHAHPGVAKALAQQAATLVHTSNLYHIAPQAELAKKLCQKSFASRAFFCNSGAEANEGALKLARKWGAKYKGGAHRIITMEASFHGRTMFSLSVTGQEKFHKGFEPLVPGVVIVPYNDADAVERAMDDETAAVLVEPVQGEGGVRMPDEGYLGKLREICDRNNALLIFDEVQTGMGRLGELFGHQAFKVEPDVMTLAKALGNGFPVGAVLANEKADVFEPGDHAATFGGNFLAARAGLAVLEEFEDGGLLEHVRETGGYFKESLQQLAAGRESVVEVRGMGLLLGMQLDRPGAEAVNYCMEAGFLINCTAGDVLRFAPPLVIQKNEIDSLMPVLDKALAALESKEEAAGR